MSNLVAADDEIDAQCIGSQLISLCFSISISLTQSQPQSALMTVNMWHYSLHSWWVINSNLPWFRLHGGFIAFFSFAQHHSMLAAVVKRSSSASYIQSHRIDVDSLAWLSTERWNQWDAKHTKRTHTHTYAYRVAIALFIEVSLIRRFYWQIIQVMQFLQHYYLIFCRSFLCKFMIFLDSFLIRLVYLPRSMRWYHLLTHIRLNRVRLVKFEYFNLLSEIGGEWPSGHS